MRCLSIATQLRKMDCDVVFLTADDKPTKLIHSHRFTTDILNTNWKHLDCETDILREYLQSRHARVLLLDSYQVTYNYLANLAQIVKVIYIDNLNRLAYPVHTVINYSVWADEQTYLRTYQNPKSTSISLSQITAYINYSFEPADSLSGTPLPHFLLGSSYRCIIYQDDLQALNPEDLPNDRIHTTVYVIFNIVIGNNRTYFYIIIITSRK